MTTVVTRRSKGAMLSWDEADANFNNLNTDKFETTYTSTATGSLQRTTQSKLDDVVSIKDFGAAGDGTTDDTVALVTAAALGRAVYLPPGIYKTTTPIVFVNGTRFIGAGNWSGVSSLNSTVGTTVIKYTGAGGANSCVVRLSSQPVGTEPTDVNTRDLMNISLTNITIDGNQLAEFGVYMVRAWSNNPLDFITVTGTVKHGFWAASCWNGSPRNWVAFKNIGAGITLGKNTFSWSNWTVDQSTCINFFAYYNGYNSSTVIQNVFNDVSNQEKEYGIGIFGSRGLVMINAQAQENSGPGIFISTTLSPVRFVGGYAENNAKSSGSTKRWDIWVNGAATANSWFIDFNGMHLGGTTATRLTGTAPSRLEAGVVFTRMPFLNDINSDWNNYRLVDCDRSVTFSGTAPSAFRERFNTSLNLAPIGICVFDATSGAISMLNSEGIVNTVTYSTTGTYVVSFKETFSSVRWVAQVTGGDNRVIGLGAYTTSGFTIYNRSTAGTLVDTNASRIMVTVWGYYV